jgi:hypothetical protein
LLSIAYLYESILEYISLKTVNTKVTLSYITNNDVPSWLSNKDNIISFPNFYNFEQISDKPPKNECSNLRIGLLGNFRTNLNNQILKSLVKYKFPFKTEIWIFGQVPKNKNDLPSGINIFGEYKDLLSIHDSFDVGYCCSPLQAGIQNKVIDYLFLNKPILIDNAVYRSFKNDDYYKILMESPLIFKDAAAISNFNFNEKSNHDIHVASLRKFVKMNESFLKINTNRFKKYANNR